MTSIVRAIDVGYGYTKFITSHDAQTGAVQCGSFPSLAPLATVGDVSGGTIARRNTTLVQVDGNIYEVGPDVSLALGTDTARVLNTRYVESAEYLALVRGALTYMDVPRVDLLVVGLPVSLVATKGQALKQRVEGRHLLSDGKEIEVAKVLVLAQPIGGLIAYAQGEESYARFRNERNLVLDPGFYTVDWLFAKGLQAFPRRCGSYPGGMHAILKRLAQAISEEHRVDFSDVTNLDEGLKTGIVMLYGRRISLGRYYNVTRPIVQEAVNAIANSVGDGRDIDSIVLVGGGADFFSDAIRERFPSHTVSAAADPAFQNVRGFQRAGVEFAQHRANVAP